MADTKFSEFTAASTLANADELVGLQGGANIRATVTVLKAALGLPDKVYVAKLTQTGSSAPTAAGAVNTTGATITLARTGAGFASITASSAVFTANKTRVFLSGTGSGGYVDPKLFSHEVSSTTVINLGAFRADNQTAEDEWVLDLRVEIYP